jgi:hypothetical protein
VTTREYRFDRVFGPATSNTDLYNAVVGDIVEGALSHGRDGTVLAYGISASGKSHSLGTLTALAPQSAGSAVAVEPGIIPRALSHIFGAQRLQRARTEQLLQRTAGGGGGSEDDRQRLAASPVVTGLRVSFVQVYLESVRDLLAPGAGAGGGGGAANGEWDEAVSVSTAFTSTSGPNASSVPGEASLPIREDPSQGVFYVEGLTEHAASTYQEACALIDRGLRSRVVGQTALNAVSSRAHALLFITIDRETAQGERLRPGRLLVCDLAGSERVRRTESRGSRLGEAKAINSSLHTLGQVISSLANADPNAHIPFRDSKLTRLLCGRLGSGTVLLATLGPSYRDVLENAGTLQFAATCLRIRPLVVQTSSLTRPYGTNSNGRQQSASRRALTASPLPSPNALTDESQSDAGFGAGAKEERDREALTRYEKLCADLATRVERLETSHAVEIEALHQRYEAAIEALSVTTKAGFDLSLMQKPNTSGMPMGGGSSGMEYAPSAGRNPRSPASTAHQRGLRAGLGTPLDSINVSLFGSPEAARGLQDQWFADTNANMVRILEDAKGRFNAIFRHTVYVSVASVAVLFFCGKFPDKNALRVPAVPDGAKVSPALPMDLFQTNGFHPQFQRAALSKCIPFLSGRSPIPVEFIRSMGLPAETEKILLSFLNETSVVHADPTESSTSMHPRQLSGAISAYLSNMAELESSESRRAQDVALVALGQAQLALDDDARRRKEDALLAESKAQDHLRETVRQLEAKLTEQTARFVAEKAEVERQWQQRLRDQQREFHDAEMAKEEELRQRIDAAVSASVTVRPMLSDASQTMQHVSFSGAPSGPNAGPSIVSLNMNTSTLSRASTDESGLTDSPVDEIEYIVSHKVVSNLPGGPFSVLYKVHWKGTASTEDEWFNREDLLSDFPWHVERYEKTAAFSDPNLRKVVDKSYAAGLSISMSSVQRMPLSPVPESPDHAMLSP